MSRLRVLLVHHDAGELDRISTLLGKAGHSVLPLETMDDASEALGLQRFDAVLAPESTQPEALAAFASTLRTIETTGRAEGRTALILCSTAGAEPQSATADRDTGPADATIPSDFSPEMFARIVEEVRAGQSQGAAAQLETTEELAVFDRQGFFELLGGNRELLDEIIGLFLEESGSQTREMENSLRTGDFVSLATVAHTLKGSLGTLHAHRARSRAQALEIAATRQLREECETQLERLTAELDELRPLLIRMRTNL